MSQFVKYEYVKVKCRHSILEKPYTMQVAYTEATGKRFYLLPPNGCDHYNGSKICEACQVAISNWFIENSHPAEGWPDPFIMP